MSRFDDTRVCAALGAAAVAVLICHHQQHFQLSLTHPQTFRIMLQHRCGKVLTGAVLWATFELMAWTLRERRGRRTDQVAIA